MAIIFVWEPSRAEEGQCQKAVSISSSVVGEGYFLSLVCEKGNVHDAENSEK